MIRLTALLLLATLAAPASAQSRPARVVAVTFDDLPGQAGDAAAAGDLMRKLVASVHRQGVPAIGFVNEGKLRPDPGGLTALLRMWRDAGLELGNHTYSHPSAHRTPLLEYLADIARGDSVTRRLLADRGARPRYFRHPMLHTGRTLAYRDEVHRVLARRGSRVAPVTFDNQEFAFALVYARAVQRRDSAQMRRIVDGYLRHMEASFGHFEALSTALFGREIPQVLLLHANRLNADHFDALAALLRRRGYRFAPMDEVLRDRAYTSRDTYTGPKGLSWLERWAATRGMELREAPRQPAWVDSLMAAAP
ncbi:MAG: polysaccharide deacetylase family protein [Gemmatimonadetes bacterium]|nr:polysaccharide deacetylase family protein [Gemmatimonadota bacterium]